MLFNPDPRKQAMEVYFSRKKSASPLPLEFNNTVQTVEVHKRLGLSLDKKLDLIFILLTNEINVTK